ncbi:hypothetical protein POM88_021897 [Heracleum sosnowskyi]|uniref:Uncharacterized protein n=1 Tax=Heracleum sosnowskyi TaxID=360622 RepID=A0AAD8IGS6_9APIA|nr:hypothetical protein POM88_021897 [Heracleum sosnowskyi]
MAEKRTFVTLQNINAEKKRKLKDRNDDKERRISTRKKLQFNDDVSTHEEKLLGLADYIKRFESPDTKAEKAGAGLPDPKAKKASEELRDTKTKKAGAGLPDPKAKKASEELRDTKTKKAGAGLPDPKAKTVGEKLGKCVEGQGCNDYEMKRNDNVAKNKAKLKELGLVPSKSAKSCQKDKGKCKETNDDASESEYVPDNNDVEAEQQSDREDDNVTSKRTKKVKRQRVEIGAGPRTRLQATKLPGSSEKKEATAGATSLPVEVNNAPVVSLKEKLKILREGPGSMALYLELRDQEKQQIEKEIPRAESQTQHLQSQSVPEKGLLLEYVQDKYIIPEDAVPWINKSMSDHFRSFKDWRILLKYWGDEKVQEIAKRNQESQNKITETHTIGATSFAQVAHKLRLEKLEKLKNLKNLEKTPIDGDAESDADCEELAKVYDADVYVATRKRKDDREYKLPPEVLKTVKDKVVSIKWTFL